MNFDALIKEKDQRNCRETYKHEAWLGIYNDILVTSFLTQGNMRLELKRGLYLGSLLLTTLFLSWSFFFTGKTNSSTFFVQFILFGMYV